MCSMSYAGSPTHLQLYRQDDLTFHCPPSDKFADSAVGEPHTALSSSQLHPRRIFTRPNSEGNIRPLNPHLFTSHHQTYQSPQSFTTIPHQWARESQSWSPQYHSAPVSLKQLDGSLHYPPFSTASPFPQSRLPPSTLHLPKRTSLGGGLTSPGNRLAFTESVDPGSGLLLRTPEHPRLRTAQACQKCRIRKAKCSGEHPTCERCVTRGLVCEYAKEGRIRGPNKPKGKSSGNPGGNEGSTSSNNATSGRPVTRRSSFSVDESTSAQARRLEIVAESRGFRRPVTARYGSSFSADSDYFFLPPHSTPVNGGHAGVDHQMQHYDIHGNSLVMQENLGFSSSVTIQHLHRESLHLSHDMSQSEFIPIGFNDASGTQSGIKSQEMIFQTIPCHQQQDESFIGSCGSPITASSIGSPLTPSSTSASMSLLPNVLHNIPSQENRFSSSNELNYHFDPTSPTHSRLRPNRENSYGCQSPMDISIC